MVIDSNIIIYAAYPQNQYLRNFIAQNDCVISTISIIETLGYHKITQQETANLSLIISQATIIDLTRDIVDLSVKIRVPGKVSLPDAVIAATAIYHNIALATNNTNDFKNITGLKLINPLQVI